MNRSHKFLIVFLILTAVFSAMTAFITFLEFDRIKAETNQAVASIIENAKTKYPEISGREIAEILNGKTNGANYCDNLKKYGIDLDSDWAVRDNLELSSIIVTANAAVCGICCIALTAVFLLYCKKRKAETVKLAGYVQKINRGEYDLAIKSNSEDEMSQLQNEIFKTTVMLKEQSDNSLKDKESLKQSLSDISHQLKTPLTSIIVMIDDILEDENMPDDIRNDFLRDIRRSTNGISFLVQSILTLSKLDANSIVFKSENESVEKILNRCVKNTAVLAEIKDVSVTVDCNSSLTLNCDFKWLCEAVTNIVKNCVEHTDEGGYVNLSAEKTSLCTKITVSDNGNGIDKTDLPHIFERFYKGKNSDENSVGIGLALAKTIIEKNGGFIVAESEPGKGTSFTLRFFSN